MKQRLAFFLGALAGGIALITTGVSAQTSTGAPTQAQIEHGLKTRGLPSFGTSPAPQGVNPGVMQANVPSYPSQERQSQPTRRAQHRQSPVSRRTASAAIVQPSMVL